MERSQSHILAFIMLTSIFLLLIPILSFSTQPMGFGDSGPYYKVALTPFLLTEFHWGYRMLVPYLAAALPFDLRLNFMIISYLSFVMINLIIFFWLRNERLSVLKSFCCCLFYSFSYAGTYNIHNFIHVGFLEHLLFLLGFIAIQKNKFLPLFLVILVGSFAKETFFLLIPLYWIVNFRINEWQKVSFKTAILLFVYIFLFYLIRISNLLFVNKVNFFSHRTFYSTYWLYEKYDGNLLIIIMMIISAFTVWFPLAILGFLFSDKRSRLLSLLIPFSAAMVVFGVDVERAVAISFPAFILLMSFLFKLCRAQEVVALLIINILVFMTYNHIWIRARFYVPAVWLGSVLFYIILRRRESLLRDVK